MTEGLDRQDWTLEELLEATLEARQNELHVALPGRIDSYDTAKQRAHVTPLIKRQLTREDGTRVDELLPQIRNVPILQLRAGAFFVHVPVAAGDTCLIIVCERDISRWLQTGEVSNAPDARLHHLSQAVAIPGLFVSSDPITPAPSSTSLELGHESGTGKIEITSSEVRAGGTKALAEHPNLDVHLTAIAAELTAMASFVSYTTTQYGTPQKTTLDGSNPIATSVTKGD